MIITIAITKHHVCLVLAIFLQFRALFRGSRAMLRTAKERSRFHWRRVMLRIQLLLLNRFTTMVLAALKGIVDGKKDLTEKQKSCGHPRASQYKHGNKYGTGTYCKRCGMRISWVPRVEIEAKVSVTVAASAELGRSSAEHTVESTVHSSSAANPVTKKPKAKAKAALERAPMYQASPSEDTSDSSEVNILEEAGAFNQEEFQTVDGAREHDAGTDDEDM